jgi:inner membrane transporter RhtA
MSHRFPLGSILGAIVSVQGGAALAKGLFPALGPVGTVGLRVVLSAIMLMAAFRPRLRGMTAAQWRAVIPYGVVLGTMNILFYLSLSRIPLGVAVTVEFVGPLGVALFGSRRAVISRGSSWWRPVSRSSCRGRAAERTCSVSCSHWPPARAGPPKSF